MKKVLNIHYWLLFALISLPVKMSAQVRDSVMFGVASYYHDKFNGRKTSNGEIFRNDSLTAAHKYLRFGTRVKVTNLNNDSSVIVRINDRLPQSSKRSIDLSQAAARKLDMMRAGIVKARIEILPYEVIKVRPEFAAYLFNEKGIKITANVIRQLKSARWKLEYITDTLHGKAKHHPANSGLVLHYGDSVYIASRYRNIAVGEWTLIDSLLIDHKEIKKDSTHLREAPLEFYGPFLIYKLDTATLVLGKPLSSDKKWHRNYHFQREAIPADIQQMLDQKKATEIKYDSLLMQSKAERARYERQRDSIYQTYPLGITREPQREVGACIIETVVYKQPDKVNVYTKKEYNWGGIFYFKNDISITQDIYEKETGIR